MISGTQTSLRATLTAFAFAAAITFMLAAAASAIVASAGADSDARETEFAASQVVASPRVASFENVPRGARVIAFSNVDGPMTTGSGGEGFMRKSGEAKVVVIGRTTLNAASFNEMMHEHSQRWSEIEPDASRRLHSAAVDAGVALRNAGYLGLVLPAGFFLSNDACVIADGLFRGGVIPVFHFPNASATQLRALRSCIRKMPRRPNTVLIDISTSSGFSLSSVRVQGSVTLIRETTLNNAGVALAGGASAVLIKDARRSVAVRDLVRRPLSDTDREIVLAASRQLDEWFASMPPIGVSPPTKREKAAAKKRKRRYKNGSRSPETGSPVGANRGGTRGGGQPKGGGRPGATPEMKGNNNGAINGPSS